MWSFLFHPLMTFGYGLIAGFVIFAIVNAGDGDEDGDTQVVILPKNSDATLKIVPKDQGEIDGQV